MTANRLILIAAGGSLTLVLAALGWQALGYAPCKLCLLQRWPHGVAVLLGAMALLLPWLILPLLGALAAATSGTIGVYHSGVERGWWPGPDTCTSADIGGLTPQQLMEQIMAAPLVRCDEIAWQFLGLSMANWNAAISFALAAIWLAAARTPRT